MLRHGGHQVKRRVVVRIEGAADIDQVLAQQRVEELALLGALADDAGLALARMHIHVAARDVDVAAEHELAPFVVQRFAHAASRFMKSSFAA